jgi:nitrogen-specific signal transduction histidine kinase
MNVISHPIRINIIKLTKEHDQDIHSIRCKSSRIQQILVNIMQNVINSLCHKETGETNENKKILLKMTIHKQNSNNLTLYHLVPLSIFEHYCSKLATSSVSATSQSILPE